MEPLPIDALTDLASLLRPDRATIFLLHGVVRRATGTRIRNYTGKHMPATRFARFLDELAVAGTAVSMPELAAVCAGAAALPEYAFAITFDDGFENNYSVAAPLLEARGIPATFYVTSSFVDSGACSWIDLIEYAVEHVKSVEIDLPFLPKGSARTHGEKIELLGAIRRHGKTPEAGDPYEFASEIWRQLGVETFEPDPDLDVKLSWKQVLELHAHDLFTVGGHGLTHRILEHLDDGALELEISEGLRLLREHVDGPIEHFSYPEGVVGCYSARVIEAVRRHGIVCAVTAEPTPVAQGVDLLQLGRHLVA